MSQTIPALDVHNLFLADAYQASFDDIFQQHTLPSQPSFYVHVPSRIDPSAAPPHKDAVIVLVPIGHMNQDPVNYDQLVRQARSLVLDVLHRRLGLLLADWIEHEIVNDPRTWQTKFNLWKGSILGLSHHLLQVLWFRPSTKDASGRYDNLYFVGASTHPGTGVPIVLAGSKLTSDQVCRGFGQVPLPRKNASHPPSLIPPFRPLWILLALVVLGFLCSFSPLLLPTPCLPPLGLQVFSSCLVWTPWPHDGRKGVRTLLKSTFYIHIHRPPYTIEAHIPVPIPSDPLSKHKKSTGVRSTCQIISGVSQAWFLNRFVADAAVMDLFCYHNTVNNSINKDAKTDNDPIDQDAWNRHKESREHPELPSTGHGTVSRPWSLVASDDEPRKHTRK
ncbi:hypothetical protein G6F38_011722 [Rhizopus arrhizus]|nr:hypothetical protein G6F38_011722 [Rhizopus arrhizus]